MAPRHTLPHQLGECDSAEIIRALGAYQEAHALTDYDLAEIAGVSRDTVGRWRRRPVSLSAPVIARLAAGIAERSEIAGTAAAELARLLAAAEMTIAREVDEPRERVRRHLNAQGLRGSAVIQEIDAAGFTIVPREDA